MNKVFKKVLISFSIIISIFILIYNLTPLQYKFDFYGNGGANVYVSTKYLDDNMSVTVKVSNRWIPSDKEVVFKLFDIDVMELIFKDKNDMMIKSLNLKLDDFIEEDENHVAYKTIPISKKNCRKIDKVGLIKAKILDNRED